MMKYTFALPLLIFLQSLYAADGWTPPVIISPSGKNNTTPQICCQGNGDAIAIWQAEPGDFILAAQFDINTFSWLSPATLTSGFFAIDPQVACDQLGHAFAVYAVDNMGRRIIPSYFNGLNWTPFPPISNPTSNVPNVCHY